MAAAVVVDLNDAAKYSIITTKSQLSPLDILIRTSWQQKMEQGGAFRYVLRHPDCKKVPGMQGYLAQFNPFRASQRRLPQTMHSVRQPFNPDKFNFNKVDAGKELVFETADGDICIINVSPIEFGHCLFIPHVTECLPQGLTLHSMQSALKIMLLTHSKPFKMAFNSLCAYASVNHLHWHLYFLQEEFEVPTASIEASPLTENGEVYEIIDYPAQGFALELKSPDDLERVSEHAFKIVHYLYRHEVAHNVFMTRGPSFSQPDKEQAIRIFIWARTSVKGQKQPEDFCMAVCELAGQVLIYNQDAFDNMNELKISMAQQETCTPVYRSIKPSILGLFEHTK